MADYDFSTLNDKEFEVLCSNLLSIVHGHRFERFKPGKDAGVDGRYFKPDGSEVVLQCKHWRQTPLERLVTHLERDERPKLEKFSPSRYVIAISHQLSRADKKRISTALHPFIIRDDDIWGREDLNDIIAQNPQIERAHYKLWIRSTAVLQHILNKAIYDRSTFALEDIERDAKLYAPTQLHSAAIEKLEKLGTIVITGAPGIGKSTLANHMVLHYVNRDFSLVQIAEDLREAENAYTDSEKQIFYFDDFLGRNYLEALSGHEGNHITQFIRRISFDKSKRFILTSRTTILNQGKTLIDVFAQNNIERNELEIRIESLRDIDKARILYNHIWHSTLDSTYIDELYVEKRYRTIIAHRNFNPRLIRFITDAHSVSDYPAEQYWNYTKGLLDNPAQVWQHPFEAQLDDFGRSIVLLVTLNRRAISQSDLAEAYSRFVARPECSGLTGRRDFMLTLRHLVGSLLNRSAKPGSTPGEANLDLFNPSIGDYVLNRYCTDIPSLRAGFTSLRNSSSIETLSGFLSSKLLTQDQTLDLVEHTLRTAKADSFVGYNASHIAAAASFILDSPNLTAEVTSLLQAATAFLLSVDPPFLFLDAAHVIEWCIKKWNYEHAAIETWTQIACMNTPYPDEIEVIERILDVLGNEIQANVAPAVEKAKISYLASNARDEFDARDVFHRATPDDLQSALDTLNSLVCEKLEHYGVAATTEHIQIIVNAYDVDTRAESYFEDHDENNDWQYYPSTEPTDQIDDLFERN